MRRRPGFTLIELLIVVVIIGILAAISIPKFRSTKGKAYTASMKSDLRNLATAQEAYAYEFATYTTDLTRLRYNASQNVVVEITSAGPSGWAARARHPAADPIECGLFFGNAPAVGGASIEGQVGCTTP